MSKNYQKHYRFNLNLILKILLAYIICLIIIFCGPITNYLSFGYELFLHKLQSIQGNIDEKTLENSDASGLINSESIIQGKPIRINIPRLGIDLFIKDGIYSNDSWNVSDTEAMYATISPFPNDNKGNTIIYGHATEQIFGKTRNLIPGDELSIYTENDYRFDYKFQSAKDVFPDDISIFSDQEGLKLTLITCKGINDAKRSLMEFHLNKVTQL